MERALYDDSQPKEFLALSRFPLQRGDNKPSKQIGQTGHSRGVKLMIGEAPFKEERIG